MVAECPSTNTQDVDQSSFWDSNGVHWDAHRVGWAVSGGCAVLTVIISLINATFHLRNYWVPLEQRQIIRIILMPPVYSIISFLSYRFFRAYTYYELVQAVYESFVLVAFLFLLVQYIARDPDEQMEMIKQKDKRSIPFPFCCIRYRPSKPYFMHALKWSVLQYAVLRPVISIIGIICEAYDVLCPQQYSIHFAQAYLTIADTVSISIALYGLIVFYGLMHDNLADRKPLAKFLSIKLIVMFIFYQGFVFSLLASHGVIKSTEFWTSQNIKDGLNALCTCIEMVIFSAFMCYAFSWKDYRKMKPDPHTHTPVIKSFIHSQNYFDFVQEAWYSFLFFIDFLRGKPYTRNGNSEFDFDKAFGIQAGGRKLAQGEHVPSLPLGPEDLESKVSLNGGGGGVRMADSVEGAGMSNMGGPGDGSGDEMRERARLIHGVPDESYIGIAR